jgi:cytochrome oxidase Cu insertion factor (SCO1/SenC/PrrC family)
VCAGLLSAWGALAGGAVATRLDQLPQQWRDDDGASLAFTDLLGQRGEQASFVIVGYDPDNDDPASWHQYRLNRQLERSNWHFLTGTPAATERLARQLGFDFWTYDTHVMHGSRLVIFDAHGQLRAALSPVSGDWPALP